MNKILKLSEKDIEILPAGQAECTYWEGDETYVLVINTHIKSNDREKGGFFSTNGAEQIKAQIIENQKKAEKLDIIEKKVTEHECQAYVCGDEEQVYCILKDELKEILKESK